MAAMIHTTALLVIEREGKVFLVKRNNRTWHGMWCFPGGHVESGETAYEAGLREGREEVGELMLDPEPFTRFIHSVPPGEKRMPSEHKHDCSVFHGRLIGEVVLSDENSEYKWVTLAEAKKMELTNYTTMAIKHLKR